MAKKTTPHVHRKLLRTAEGSYGPVTLNLDDQLSILIFVQPKVLVEFNGSNSIGSNTKNAKCPKTFKRCLLNDDNELQSRSDSVPSLDIRYCF